MCSILKQNPDKESNKEYPSNMGQKWTIEEENTLLSELDKNLTIEIIALSHNRTTGGIIGRQRNIAYNMYRTNVSIEEIIIKTKLNREQITEIIARKENPTYSKEKNKEKNKETVKPKNKLKPEKVKTFSLENEVIEIKNEIKFLKNTMNELVGMMKAVYEFEDA